MRFPSPAQYKRINLIYIPARSAFYCCKEVITALIHLDSVILPASSLPDRVLLLFHDYRIPLPSPSRREEH